MKLHGLELTDPFELTIKGRDEPIGYACPKCGAVFLVNKSSNERLYESGRKRKQEEAASHCVKDCPCGKPIEDSYRLRCRACRDQMEADRERALFEKSTKLAIEQYDGPLYWEGHCGGMGDGYFGDVDDLLDYCELEGVDVPEYVWACTRHDLRLDADCIVEHAVSDMYEDAYDHVGQKAIDVLQAYLDAWCKEVAIVSWSSDTSRSILLREADTALTG
jgi:hypothetical protein